MNPLNGKVASGSGAQNGTYTFVNGQQTQDIERGIQLVVKVPGVGQFRLVGRVIYGPDFGITFQTPKAALTPEFTGPLCAALE